MDPNTNEIAVPAPPDTLEISPESLDLSPYLNYGILWIKLEQIMPNNAPEA